MSRKTIVSMLAFVAVAIALSAAPSRAVDRAHAELAMRASLAEIPGSDIDSDYRAAIS